MNRRNFQRQCINIEITWSFRDALSRSKMRDSPRERDLLESSFRFPSHPAAFIWRCCKRTHDASNESQTEERLW